MNTKYYYWRGLSFLLTRSGRQEVQRQIEGLACRCGGPLTVSQTQRGQQVVCKFCGRPACDCHIALVEPKPLVVWATGAKPSEYYRRGESGVLLNLAGLRRVTRLLVGRRCFECRHVLTVVQDKRGPWIMCFGCGRPASGVDLLLLPEGPKVIG